jgi:radical SAM superfamily enzyme YgiQ (UPF0313 family)
MEKMKVAKESKVKTLVYMAELTYCTTVISIESFPIAVGYVTAYCEKMLPGRFSFELFKFPDPLLDSIDKTAPDILGMSYFPWNQNMVLMIADYYKKAKPEGMVVLGGSNISFDPDEQADFMKNHPEIDMFVVGDGEYPFKEILERHIEFNGDKDKVLSDDPIEGCAYYTAVSRKFLPGLPPPRTNDINEIPSPYLTGLMDPFFDNQLLTPMVQASRGCPFSCEYCWAGNKYNSRIRSRRPELVIEELQYIAELRKENENQLLTFADSNFGMYKGDEVIGDAIAHLQEELNFPSSFYSPCGKENKNRVFNIIKKIRNAAAIVSVQSTDAQILKNVSRQTINLDEYRDIVIKFKKAGIPVETEIITGMPGETRDSHLQTIKDLIYMEIDEIHAFTLMFLEGTGLNTSKSQKEYNWDKRYRLLPRNFGKIRGKICFEVETVAVGSKTFDFEDYLYFRRLHGALRIVFNHAFFSEFINYMRQNKVDLFDFCLSFADNLEKDPGSAGDQFRMYLQEIRDEVWDSREDLFAYFTKEENYQKLLTGEKGENLLGKYKAMIICENFDSWCEFYYQRVFETLDNEHRNTDIEAELSDIRDHIITKADRIMSPENGRGEPQYVTLHHDIKSWQKDNYTKPLSYYKFPSPVQAEYVIKTKHRKIVQEILHLHSKENSDLWKAVSSRYYLPALFRECKQTK